MQNSFLETTVDNEISPSVIRARLSSVQPIGRHRWVWERLSMFPARISDLLLPAVLDQDAEGSFSRMSSCMISMTLAV
jgi:hypothetical protein